MPAGGRLERFPKGGLMDIRRVGVIGAGTMGNGIAHVFARSGFRVILCDVEQRFLDRGLATITKNLDREVAKNKITAEDKASALETDRAGDGARQAGGLRFHRGGGDGEVRNQGGDFSRSRRHGAAGGDSGFEHVVDLDHEARGADRASRQSDWDALLQSCAGDEIGGGDSRAGDFTGDVSRRCATWR